MHILSPELKAIELVELFGTPEMAIKCVDLFIQTTGSKYWYSVKLKIETNY